MSSHFVSVIIPTYRRPDVLRLTLQALRRIEPQDSCEFIIVDNDGSSDHPRLLADELRSSVDVPVRLITHTSGGVAGARNAGARSASGDVLLFLDDDILVEPDTIRKHLRRLEECKPCLVSGIWHFSPEMVEALDQTPFGRFRRSVEEWQGPQTDFVQVAENAFERGGVPACNLSVFRDDFWRIGGFDEAYPYASSEDLDFSLRAKQLGYRLIHDADIRIWHNDRRLDFRDYCQRQRQRHSGTALLAAKFPQFDWVRPTMAENGPISWSDPFPRIARKVLKKLLSQSFPLSALHRATDFLERRWPSSTLLPRLYWSMCGLHIYAGVQHGAPTTSSRSPRPRILYIAYWGAVEPLGQSLIVPAVERLAASSDLTLITFDKPADLRNGDATSTVRERLQRSGVKWSALRYHKRPKIPATLFDIVHGVAVGVVKGLRRRPTVIHGRTFIGGIIGRAVATTLRVPFLYHNEGFYPDEQVDGGVWREGSMPHRIAKRIESSMYASADAIICMSRRSKAVLERLAEVQKKSTPVLVVPSCVDLQHFRRDSPPARSAGLRLIYIGSVGNRYILDRVARFVAVASTVIAGVHLRILTTADRDLVVSMLRAGGLPDDVWSLGRVPHADMPSALANADAGLFFLRRGISEFGCSPTKIGEYWAMGIPVITTAGVSDTDDIIREHRVGVIITDHSDEAYRRAAIELQQLLADVGLAQRCREAAEEYYALAPRCEAQLALYQRLAAGRHATEFREREVAAR